MKDYIILTDTTSDLTAELRKQYNIEYVQMGYVIDGKEYPASLDWESCSPKEFYDKMRDGVIIKTTQVSVENFEKAFRSAHEQGKDLLYVACSSALSGSYNTACVVAREMKEELAGTKILCVDALNSCAGEGMLAITASQLRAQGKTIEETAAYLEANRLKVHQAAAVATLDYLRRAGRVTASSAFFGNIFGIKPILISDAKGQNYAVKKVKGRRASLQALIEDVKENIVDPESQTLFISHADCQVDADFLKEHLEKEIPCKGIYTNYIAPIVGASVGPGTVAVYYIGEPVTIIGE